MHSKPILYALPYMKQNSTARLQTPETGPDTYNLNPSRIFLSVSSLETSTAAAGAADESTASDMGKGR